MKKLDRFLARRKELVQNYNEAFRDNKDIITPYQMEGTESGWPVSYTHLDVYKRQI